MGVRWVDVNKGDECEKNYRSHLAGKEFKTITDDCLYAATPPLEALRFILSDAETSRSATGNQVPSRQAMVNDAARAYVYEACTRDVYIELPAEDGAGPDAIENINLCFYGTRDAATNWPGALSDQLARCVV